MSAPLVLVGGAAYGYGVSAGSARLVQLSSISQDDAAAYHLSTFPAQRAAAFGVSYLMVCLTHPAPGDAAGAADRLASLARMTSAGVATGCGWAGGPVSAAPLTVTWNGTVKPLQGVYSAGAAAQLGFAVTTEDGRTFTVLLPVWTSGPAALRVIGDVAIVPSAQTAPAPVPAAPALTDPLIAEQVTAGVLLPFLRAWGASDAVQLNLVLARDATSAARAGMDGQLSNPLVSSTLVVVTRGDPQGYREGDLVTAQVLVDWSARVLGAQRTGYSIALRMTAGRWQVVDITGAAADPAGGAAPGTAFPTAPAG